MYFNLHLNYANILYVLKSTKLLKDAISKGTKFRARIGVNLMKKHIQQANSARETAVQTYIGLERNEPDVSLPILSDMCGFSSSLEESTKWREI